ncbi:MAG: superinfection immunity protein [Firmicutes bacterium]|nr:superinfection immunity protein [Bacillota bacterium]
MRLVVATFWFLLVFVAAIALYFVPAIVAYRRRAEPRLAILLLNLFFGWTLLIWILLLIWAYEARSSPA